MNEKIWLSPPHMGGQEQKYVKEAFDTNWVAPLGPNVNEFENSLENYLGNSKKIVAVSSGTAAIHLGLILAGVTQGDEVLCQSFTFSASANPIIYQGAFPVFVDSEPDTWNMDPILLEQAIVEGISRNKKPKAIIVIHMYGVPYKVNEIHELAKHYKIVVLEDAAGALGSEVNGQKCGTFGDIGIVSFNGNKIITTSGGGALVVNASKLKEKAIFLATQARDDVPYYQHSHIGYNYRMSNVLAGIGRGQMEVLKERIRARRLNYERYKKELNSLSNLHFVPELTGSFSNRWLTCILTESFKEKETIRLSLERENIEARYVWKPMHQQPIFNRYRAYVNGVSDNLFKNGLCLPSGSNLTQKEIVRIASIIKIALRKV